MTIEMKKIATTAPRMFETALVTSILLLPHAHASEREQTLVNRNTTLNLIEALVARGILDRESADSMIREAREQAVLQAKEEMERDDAATAAEAAEIKPESASQHVYYIPKVVKDELRREVREDLRDDVVTEVKAQAKQEQWGVPAALPSWVNRFTLYGDLRLRGEADLFGSDNQPFSYLDWPEINDSGGLSAAGVDAFLNTTEDRTRFRSRLRLGINAQVTEGLQAGIRISTSNDRSPISLNQTLGQTGQQYELALDRVFIRYDYTDANDFDWATLWAGRHVNPWFSTETMFDRDLSFEGLAGTFRIKLGSSADASRTAGSPFGNWGYSQANSVYVTLGAFPLQEVELSSRDKWLFGAQGGVDWAFDSASRFKFGLAYYDYANVKARVNPLGSRKNDFTAPEFFTKGNSLVRISNDIGETLADPRLVGLASDFDIVDVTAAYDLARFAPIHVVVTGSYADNIGFDRGEILERTGVDISPRTAAWEVRLDVGYPQVRKRHDWSLFGAYKRVERDAVLDAFTDSLFHLGGTDAKGWVLGGSYGVAKNTWVSGRWLSSDEIDGPPLGIDVLVIDLTTGF